MAATLHKHTTELGTGTCTICFGEGFSKAAEMADDLFTKLSKSTLDLKDEMHHTRVDVDIKLAALKVEANLNERKPSE